MQSVTVQLPTDVPLEPYKYPQEGVTGLNAWEKFQPKHNEGTGIKYGDFEARDKLVEKYRKIEEEAKARTAKEKADKEKAAQEKEAALVPVQP